MNTTDWWVTAAIVVLVGYDVFAKVHWGYQGTISYNVLQAAKEHPVIPLVVGVVCGHLFWPQ